ncbi:hypothetical protein ABID99_005306 [Mucilaginibacter sp. OAE612]|uniref:GIY-YIG nuclease family protein n=1 Tax=Mucilaginibacter sp. OAE612 TaxID=3156444 RepID=UPI00359ED123
MIEEIVKSFEDTKQFINDHINYPVKPGIYAFYLSEAANFSIFGIGRQLIYIGIAKHSLNDRDFKQHFNSKKTGSSTLRRSIGAILKEELKLKAIPRGGVNDTKRFLNYKFINEQELTDWMISNLQIGYWLPIRFLSYEELRLIESELTKVLKPTLDLDKRTRKYNLLADKLDLLRQFCRIEASQQK